MPRYEYKVVPAPKKPGKIKGVKGTENRFAAQLATLMNTHGSEGWEYQRTDTLPCESRQGLTGRATTFQNMLVFRREIKEMADESPAPPVAEKGLSAPDFRATASPAAPDFTASSRAPEGDAPELTPDAPDPERQDIAAQ